MLGTFATVKGTALDLKANRLVRDTLGKWDGYLLVIFEEQFEDWGVGGGRGGAKAGLELGRGKLGLVVLVVVPVVINIGREIGFLLWVVLEAGASSLELANGSCESGSEIGSSESE